MSVSVSPTECDNIEIAAQLQRDSELWEAQGEVVSFPHLFMTCMH